MKNNLITIKVENNLIDVKQFLKEEVVETGNINNRVSISALYITFKTWCAEVYPDETLMTQAVFVNELVKLSMSFSSDNKYLVKLKTIY